MYALQTTVEVAGREFHITNNGDFRMVLDCFSALGDEQLSEDYRVLASLLIFYNEFDDMADLMEYQDYLEPLVKEMYKFFNCGSESSPGAVVDRPLIDWEGDSQMISSAVNNVANKEIRAVEYMHWWTFMGYYMSVGESVLATVVGIREKVVHGKKLEKHEQEFRKKNPEYFIWKSSTVSEREADALIRELWNKN